MDGTKLYSTRGCIARPGKGEFLPGQEMNDIQIYF